MESAENVQELRSSYQSLGRRIRYGTAGFRDRAENLDYVAYKVGAFVALLNHTSPSKVLGVVVSASHNHIQDNGLKISNFEGNMLDTAYEPEIEQFLENEDEERAIELFKLFLLSKKKTFFTGNVYVCVGGDTRPSTQRLLDLVKSGIRSQGGVPLDFGTTTTPQLFFYVSHINRHIKPKMLDTDLQVSQVKSITSKYWQTICGLFKSSQKYCRFKSVKQRTIDCANGVGGQILPFFLNELKEYFDVTIINNTQPDLLNEKCGTDFVYSHRQFPSEYKPNDSNSFVCFDGDADRIVLFYEDKKALKIIDGDRIGVLLTIFYQRLIEKLRKETDTINQSNCMHIKLPLDDLKIGFVQTYYANSASSEYLKNQLCIEPEFVATGVKHLHTRAQKFDIGVYFEANGHGTVLFERGLPEKIEALLMNRDILEESVKSNQPFHDQLQKYFDFLEFFHSNTQLPNRAAGDAICDFLLIENALEYLDMSYRSLGQLYDNYKSSTTKIKVKSKHLLKVSEVEDKVLEPEYLQEKIDGILSSNKGVKAFVRASGTEDVLRLHVQGTSEQQIKRIEEEIYGLIAEDKVLN